MLPPQFHISLIAVLASGLFAVPLVAADPPGKDAPLVAHIKLSGTMSEEGPSATDSLLGPASESFKMKLDRIAKAKKDKNVKALYLQIGEIGGSWGKVNELRAGIADFRKSGKRVYGYLEEGANIDYAVACSCDHIAMPESGSLMLTGVRFELSFYKDLFEKVGLQADMMQMGDFKGAGETFTRNKISPENRKQWDSVVQDFYDQLVENIAASRKDKGFTEAKVREIIDQGPFTAKKALELGLIDSLAYPDQYQKSAVAEQKLEKLVFKKDYAKPKQQEIDFSNPFNLLKLLNTPKEPKLSDKPKLALIYASGEIVTGKSSISLLGGSTLGSTTMIEAIRKAEEEPTVKAIVLRVDSPGGSALASDLIWSELVKCKKPVIASMSDVAGSGGYYISMPARKIFAEPGTITGSIGVVGGKIVVGGVYQKAGINTEVISRGANANVLSMTTPFSDSERKAMRAFMQDIYDQFLDKTVQCRNKAGKSFTKESLTRLAGGRIWSGRQAKENGLVDELGTLEDALAAAKVEAKLPAAEDVELLILPKAGSLLDGLMDRGLDAHLPVSKLAESPAVAPHLRTLDVLMRLNNEMVWTMIPYKIEAK